MIDIKKRRSKRKALPMNNKENERPKRACKVKKVIIRLNKKKVQKGIGKNRSLLQKLNDNYVSEEKNDNDVSVKVIKKIHYKKKINLKTKNSSECSIENGISEIAEQFILESTTVTKDYNKKQNSHIKRMTNFAKDYKNGKAFGGIDFNDLFDLPATKQKKKMFNDLMCKFMYLLKKTKKLNREECPFYEPGSQNTFLRTLFSALKAEHRSFGWNLADFAYTGGFVSVITQLYQQRSLNYTVS